MASVSGLKIDFQLGTDRKTAYATWNLSSKYTKHLKHYKVVWLYTTGNGVSFEGSNSTTTYKNSTFSIPENAIKIKCRVTPVSTTYKEKKTVKDKKGKKTTKEVTKSYFTGTAVTYTKDLAVISPDVPKVPTVSISKDNKLTMTVSDIVEQSAAILTNKIQFYLYNATNKTSSSTKVKVSNQKAQLVKSLTPGCKYKVKCRAINTFTSNSTGIDGMEIMYTSEQERYSGWTEYSEEIITTPSKVAIQSCKPDSETSVKLVLGTSSLATDFEVEYTTQKKYFDSSTETSSASIKKKSSKTNTIYITGLDSAETWYFRARAINGTGESGWSNIVSTVLGTKPSPPTTWSLTTTANVGENVVLYWTHNSEDGSNQTAAIIEINVNGKKYTLNIDSADNKDNDNPIYSKTINLSNYNCVDGSKLLWRVRTKGILNSYSDWSVQRTIEVYAKPTIELLLGDDSGILTHFPYVIKCTPGPNSQTPISYHINIKSKNSYDCEDVNGETVYINAGDEVFSETFISKTRPLYIQLLPSNIILENNQSYIVTVIVSMSSGMIAETVDEFEVSWDDDVPTPDGSIYIDEDELTAIITPRCEDDDGNLDNDVTLSVYRKEADGNLVEIANELENNGTISVVDPHPALYYARYRIVAKSKITSNIAFEDLPPEPVLENAIVITWDESYKQLEYEDENAQGEDYPIDINLERMILYLPYNIDISESHKNDVSLIEYIGRKNPVSYYGTQKGETATWSASILKNDIETLNLIRKLAVWLGDVYVREPSGSGYWAKIDVSIDIKHSSVVIPVTFSVERVEGGI